MQQWDSWKGPYQVLLTTVPPAKLSVKPWVHILQLKKAPLLLVLCKMLESSKSSKLVREVTNIKVDCFLPKHWIKNISFHSFFLLDYPLLILLPWRSLWLFCPPFCLLWPRKIMSLFIYLSPLPAGVIQPPNDHWICHDTCDPVVLTVTDFSWTLQFLNHKLSLLTIVSWSLTPGSIAPPLVNNSKSGKTCSQALWKDRDTK